MHDFQQNPSCSSTSLPLLCPGLPLRQTSYSATVSASCMKKCPSRVAFDVHFDDQAHVPGLCEGREFCHTHPDCTYQSANPSHLNDSSSQISPTATYIDKLPRLSHKSGDRGSFNESSSPILRESGSVWYAESPPPPPSLSSSS